jgi:hypothetical protein
MTKVKKVAFVLLWLKRYSYASRQRTASNGISQQKSNVALGIRLVKIEENATF